MYLNMILLLKGYFCFCVEKIRSDEARFRVKNCSIFYGSGVVAGTKVMTVEWRDKEGFKIYL